MLNHLGRCLKLIVSSRGTFCHEFASQFGLEFFIRKTTPNQSPAHRPARSHASAPPTIRTAQFERQFIPSRQVATYVTILTKCPRRLWMVLLAPRQNHPRLRERYPLCKDPAKHGSDPAKRGSICEAFGISIHSVCNTGHRCGSSFTGNLHMRIT